MQLFYRGSSYEYTPARTGNVAPQSQLTYRGASYFGSSPLELTGVSVGHTAHTLSYRGTAYSSGRTAQAEQATSAARAETLLVAQVLTPQNVARVHRANINENLQRRLQVARAKGDQSLISLLADEQQQITFTWGTSDSIGIEVKPELWH